MSDELLTVGDVVRRWGKPDTSVRRDLKAGRMPNALQPGHEGRAAWGIPASDVEALYGPEPTDDEPTGPEVSTDELDELRRQLQDERARVAVLEATIAGQASTIEGWKAAAEMAETLKQLTPVLTALATQADTRPAMVEASTQEPPATPRRRWWQGREPK